jgi:serpin B
MRCLILIALCFVLANASFYNKNRFERLLNRYQNRFGRQNEFQNRFGNEYENDEWNTDNEWNTNEWNTNDYKTNLLGSDDVDDHIQDYVDEIRRERMLERNQCPRDIEGIFGGLNEDESDTEFETENCRGRQCYYGNEDDETEGFKRSPWMGRDDETEEFGRTSWMKREREFENSPITEITDANVKLTSRLYKQCKDERDDKNTVVSPLSIQLALAALNQGARGNTKRQIGRVVAGRLQYHQRRQILKKLVRHLKGFGQQTEYSTLRHTTKINPVTGIFVTKTTHAQRQFVQMVKGTLGATVKHCSFHQQPQQCRQMINQWVSQKTHHKINKIIPQDAITDNTKMILVNALELKANWGPQMRRHQTKQAKFFPLDTNKPKTVQVMETQGRFKYHEDELVKVVGIPTEQKEMTLYVVVPKEKDGLTEVEKLHLQDGVQLKDLLKTCDRHVRHVGVQLPKFQIKHKVDVRRTLRKQGVTDAFDPQRADFSGITGVNQYDMEETDEIYGQQWTKYRRNPFLNTFRPSHYYGNEMETEMGMGMGMDETTGTEHKLHLNKFIHQTVIKITEQGITATAGSGLEEFESRMGSRHGGRHGGMEMTGMDEIFGESDDFYGQQHHSTSQKVVKANHAFAFVLKHNPTNQVVLVGRVIDAAQRKVNFVPQTINTVDQY